MQLFPKCFTASLLASLLCGCEIIRPAPSAADPVKTIEVAIFEGGYGIDWHEKMARLYSEQHASDGIRIELWGDPRVVEKIKPRLLRRDPPEVVLVTGLPMWRLIADGKLYPIDSALDQPAYGDPEHRWRDLFIAGTLDTYRSGDNVYAIPSAFAAWSCWYSARLFREHGWTPPRTWSEFDALCDKIKRDGIAPLAFQGKYPFYAWYTYFSLVQRCGGLAAINRINALEPDAFSHPDAIRAATLLQDMAVHHFQRGALAMTHTESQLQFVNDQAAMIFCGIWLENEMKNTTPPDFEMRAFNVPAVEGGKGNPRLFNGQGSELFFVPAESRYPELALDFLRFLISPPYAPDIGSSIGIISPLKGAVPREALSPALQSVLDMMDVAPGIFQDRITSLLPEWLSQVLNPNLSSLMRGEISPEEFGRRLDAGVRQARHDPDLIIPPFVPFNPVEFGEPS
ncbi:MAG: extracellular solute-binding protein [Candidatus Hydrogenedentes bacterium]|nr:extracellular solute-binding protein [Candidatus Hydrogenedentota bacterium]